MSYTDNQLQSRGSGNWKIYVHKDGGAVPPSVRGELLIDNAKYSIVKSGSREAVMIVPSGNVAFAINLDEANDPVPTLSSSENQNPFTPRDIDRG